MPVIVLNVIWVLKSAMASTPLLSRSGEVGRRSTSP